MPQRKTIAIIVAACGGFGTLLIASCAGLLFAGFKHADSTASPRIDAMFSAIENNRVAETYETDTTQELRTAVTKEQYTASAENIGARLGKLKSKSIQGFATRQSNANSYIDVTYNATFESGQGTIIAKLKKEDGTWKFLTFQVKSPVFRQDVATAKCLSCGELHKPGARFCPSCGAEIAKEKDAGPLRDKVQSSTTATEQTGEREPE